METYLAIASKRDTRHYADRPVSEEVVRRILEAGRVSGSARNRQPGWFDFSRQPGERSDWRGQL